MTTIYDNTEHRTEVGHTKLLCASGTVQVGELYGKALMRRSKLFDA
jgi:hypothetical protein